MSIEEQIPNKNTYKNLTYKELKEAVTKIMFNAPEKREYIMYTGLYGMYNFEFAMGGIGIPSNYIHHGFHKYISRSKNYYIYITLSIDDYYGSSRKNKTCLKHSPIKAKIKMGNTFPIELFYGTKSLGHFDNFDNVNKYLIKFKNK